MKPATSTDELHREMQIHAKNGEIKPGRAHVSARDMTLWPIGRSVRIGTESDIEGVITGINITGTGVQYQVAWWNGATRSSEWLTEDEIADSEPPSLKIGFK